jgi:hypothetical protein
MCQVVDDATRAEVGHEADHCYLVEEILDDLERLALEQQPVVRDVSAAAAAAAAIRVTTPRAAVSHDRLICLSSRSESSTDLLYEGVRERIGDVARG